MGSGAIITLNPWRGSALRQAQGGETPDGIRGYLR